MLNIKLERSLTYRVSSIAWPRNQSLKKIIKLILGILNMDFGLRIMKVGTISIIMKSD